MDWITLLLATLVLIPIVFAFWGFRKKHQIEAELKVRKLMLRIGVAEEKKLSFEELLLSQGDRGWFQFFVVKFKQAGIVERNEIVRILLIQGVLIATSLLLIAVNLLHLSMNILLLALLLPMLPTLYLIIKASQRQAQLRKDFPEMLDSIVRSLQAGFGIDGALQNIAEDSKGPLAEEIAEIHKQLKLGISLRELLREFQSRVSLPEASYFAITLILQRESGGQLTAILKELSRLMRRRENFQAKLRTLTAESRFTAWFIGGMPLAYLGYKLIFDYPAMHFFLHDPTGVKLLSLSVFLILLGAVILRNMLRIRF
ncbi:type II secretion system F family protein [Thiomicrorhabdus xiamenensis]|uniref:Type II secretion system F family protein n=1 Tax=Thiomicrorhabdus xiamenensis TaxID=2739063 RepID=A0A7D4SRN7_9GAMM|nr:type II secretion system F family protein [Thiomicrorhabdus xiamenensis]QKI88603.1 type II secretion system F family protein [Thiomicrorhabdus xiamenensis]